MTNLSVNTNPQAQNNNKPKVQVQAKAQTQVPKAQTQTKAQTQVAKPKQQYYSYAPQYKYNNNDVYVRQQPQVQRIAYKQPKSKEQNLQTISLVMGIAASLTLIGALAGPKVGSWFNRKQAGKIFIDLKDDIPKVDNLDSLNAKTKTFLENIIKSSKVSNETFESAGKPKGDRSILLYGLPGTGKSFFAKVAAKSMDAKYAEIDFSQIASPYVGQASKNIRDKADIIMDVAKKNPKQKFVVTFNEIDALIQEDPMGASHTAEVRSTMLNILEQIQELPNVLIVGTTNRNPKASELDRFGKAARALDKASIDRFHSIIEIPLPDQKCISAAMKDSLNKMPAAKDFVEKQQEQLTKFSKQLEAENYSHRKLSQLVEKAKTLFMIDKNADSKVEFGVKYLEEAHKLQQDLAN